MIDVKIKNLDTFKRASLTWMIHVMKRMCLPLCLLGCTYKQPTSERPPLTIFAASSLTEVAEALRANYQKLTPNSRVRLNIAGSQSLRFQIEQGAYADLFLSANRDHIDTLNEAGELSMVVQFAENELALVTPSRPLKSGANRLEQFEALPSIKRFIIGAETTPIGAYTRLLFMNIKQRYGTQFIDLLTSKIVSKEMNARVLRAKVEMGEADAAFIYRTDVNHRSNIRMIPIPAELNITTAVFGATLTQSRRPKVAQDLVQSLCKKSLIETLSTLGFSPKPVCQL